MPHWNFLYPIGAMGFGFANTLFNQWIVYFHARSGTSALIGSLLLLNFMGQGLFNPILGYLGDRFQHRWGRRRFFLLLGALPLALSFQGVWLFHDPGWSLLFICSYGLLFVTVVQPYVALLPVMAPTPAARVRYSLATGVCSLVATGCALLLGPLLLERLSFAQLGTIGAGAIIVTLFIPALLMHEPLTPPLAGAASGRAFMNEMLSLWRNPALRAFVLGNGCVTGAVIALTLVSPFVGEALLGQERGYTRVLNSCTFAGVLLAISFVSLWGRHLSFVTMLRALLAWNSMLILLLSVLHWQWRLPAQVWWLGFVSIGCLLLISMMSPSVVLSEISDTDGGKRTGLIFGLNGLVMNFGNALTSQLSALLLTRGHSAAEPVGVYSVLILAAVAAITGGVLLKQARVRP
jgi:GPH family glycoside/pentoside/hexuronide:cation symporter